MISPDQSSAYWGKRGHY